MSYRDLPLPDRVARLEEAVARLEAEPRGFAHLPAPAQIVAPLPRKAG